MKNEQIKYIQKYLNLESDKINENSDLIKNLVFNNQELEKDKKQVSKTIYEHLNCKPAINFEFPDNKKFGVCLTHDIDDIYPPFSHTVLSSLYCIKNLNFNELKRQLFWKNKGKELSPYWNFKKIMKLEDKYEAKSSFYFIATDRDIHRFRYDVEELENELGFIADNGWEVGLHGGYYSYNNLEEIKKEKKRLEKVAGKEVIGYRNHYLMFKYPDTWELLARAGLKYDTTCGYNDMIGFRNGLCHPFKPFNVNTDKEINILEIPLNIMDGALFNSMKSSKEAWENAKKIIDTVEKYNGVLTLLWHNNVFDCPYTRHWFKLYEKILEYVSKKDAWITSGKDIWRRFENEYKETG